MTDTADTTKSPYTPSPGAVALAVLADLDRCIHGRHKPDPCGSCPNGQSAGNGFAPPGRRIGTTVHAEGIYVPEAEDRYDRVAWHTPPADPTASDDPALTAVYRERARLVAFLASTLPSVITPAPDYEGWFIVYVNGPAGQMSWHLAPGDVDLFPDTVARVASWEWDGHDTDEKYRRLDAVTRASTEGVTL
ncbi:hypothetical protein [Streptomyces sp. NPDC049879]|uniref:WDGH domain-containing protein n=1 Tax=Streptomyces sp. NPDC049879 TaxID=3365598 RepID=UPI0037A389EF